MPPPAAPSRPDETPPTLYHAAATAPARPPLDGSRRAEVAIIGGGLTGLGAALALAERGVRPVLLEAQRIGWGASGRNGGQLLAGLGGDLAAVARRHGRDTAQALFSLSCEAVAAVKARIATHAIDCGLTSGHVTAALKPRHVTELTAEQALWQSFGHDGLALWSEEELRAVVRSPRYIGGLYDASAGHLDPLAYALALARLAESRGAVLHEHTPVTRLDFTPEPVLVTPRGEVRAERVLVCANAYLDGLIPALAGEIMPVASCVVATEPLGPARLATLLTRPIAVADANLVLDYFRPTRDHRLLFGGRANYAGRPPHDIAAALRPRLDRLFPQLGPVNFDHRWAGLIAITRDRMPRLGRLGPTGFFAHGYSGHGLALSGLAGTILAEASLGRAERLEIFERLPRRPFPGGFLKTPLLVLAMLYYRLRDLL
jgi:gamma-glutamylputrescine oxidase